jgi:predicted RNase H-like HicB family nuclease
MADDAGDGVAPETTSKRCIYWPTRGGVYNTHHAERRPHPRVERGRVGLKTRSRLAARIHSSSTARNRGCATSQARVGRRPCRSHPQASWSLMMHHPIAIESRTDQTAYGVVVPDLPSCFSAGETLEEAIAGAGEAALAGLKPRLTPAIRSRHPPPSRRSARSRNLQAGFFRSSLTIRLFSTTPSSGSTSRCRVGCWGPER